MPRGDEDWTAEVKALGDEIVALTVRQAVELARHLRTELFGEEESAEPGTLAKTVGSYDIALGLRDHLLAFRDALVPEATTFDDWEVLELVSADTFRDGFSQVVNGATTIHFNLQGIQNVSEALQLGRNGYDWKPMGFSSNYTNYELFSLSLWAKYGTGIQTADQILAKIRWYDGASSVAPPPEFAAMWPNG
jgi:hypothetical protein